MIWPRGAAPRQSFWDGRPRSSGGGVACTVVIRPSRCPSVVQHLRDGRQALVVQEALETKVMSRCTSGLLTPPIRNGVSPWRGGHDDVLGARVDVALRLVLGRKRPVDSTTYSRPPCPRAARRVFDGEHRISLPLTMMEFGGADGALNKRPLHGIVLEPWPYHPAYQIVDADKSRPRVDAARKTDGDAAKPVDATLIIILSSLNVSFVLYPNPNPMTAPTRQIENADVKNVRRCVMDLISSPKFRWIEDSLGASQAVRKLSRTHP